LVSGPEDGQLLVFHTGTPSGLVPLPPALEPSSLGVRTVLYARPGYGGSTPQPGRRVADAAADTTAILDALGVEQFINIGWSGGGPHALACEVLLAGRCQATAVIAGIAPYRAIGVSDEVRAYYEDDEDNRLALSGDVEGFRRACDALGAQLSKSTGAAVTANAKSAADRVFLAGSVGDWVAAFYRQAFTSGSSGDADDFLAFFSDWGFSLEETRRVALWHGDEDQNVPIAHMRWLNDHLPDADLRVIESEGHVSILRHLPDILADLRSTIPA
jgi:pimeloyl-ACP methyl ester carboxylesterase